MGARFTKYQPALPVSVRSGEIEIIDLLGQKHYIKIPINITIENDIMDFQEDVFVNVIQGNIQLVLRRDMTWSVIHNPSRLLLDIGVFEFKDNHLFYTDYRHIGYMSANGRVSAILLDLSNRRIIHGMRGPSMSNGYDFVLKEPLDKSLDISTEVAMSAAHTYAKPQPKLHIWTSDLQEVEVEYDVMARDFQI